MLMTKEFFAYFLIGAMFGVVYGVYASGMVDVINVDLCESAVAAAKHNAIKGGL